MKYKRLTAILIVSAIYLSGCNVEKTVIVPKSDPDKLFAESQIVLKKEMPAANFEINANDRIIKATETQNVDYPSYIEMKFAKKMGDTAVTLIVPEEEPQRIENLAFLLKNKLQVRNIRSLRMDDVRPNLEPPERVQKGRPVKNERDRQLDRNRDGWVSPMEAQMRPMRGDMY